MRAIPKYWMVEELIEAEGDTNPNQSKLEIGDLVQIVDPFLTSHGHEGYVTDTQWGREYFKHSWAYQIHPYKRYFGPWQLRRVVRE